jgi:hypothetical protein
VSPSRIADIDKGVFSDILLAYRSLIQQ